MAFPKQIKDIVYNLLQEPTLDNFRAFLENQTGEHNSIDFKREWICKDKLAKLMLVSVQISKTCSSRNGLLSASVPGAVKTSMRARKTSTAGIVAVSS